MTHSPSGRRRARKLAALALAAATGLPALVAARPAAAQTLDNYDRGRGKAMLAVIKKDIQKNYYDPKYHGMDVEAHFAAAEAKIDQATTFGQVFAVIAQTLLDLDDSHTFFLPPERAMSVEYGWRMDMIGDKCFVTAVKPGSDAEAKGLKPGDRIYAVEGFKPTRATLWKMDYFFNALRPQASLRVLAQSPSATAARELVLDGRTKATKRIIDVNNDTDVAAILRGLDENDVHERWVTFASSLFVWKMPGFYASEQDIDRIVDKARGSETLVIDLRGNGGGSETTLLRLVGNLFDRDVTVGTIKRRQETKPLVAKARNGKPYTGKVIVLIDGKSGSASELFARVVQLEKRGTVIGDRSAGAVMRSRHYGHEVGGGTVIPYGASVTDADIVMTDGASLEHVGVTPDELLLPKAEDMAAGRDPVLVRAAALAGVELDPVKAGALFPVEWPKL